MDVTRGTAGELVIRVDGTFDGKAATCLAGWLAEVPPQEPLVVDFTGVRECQDLGLAAVAQGLSSRGEHLAVRGLTRHQERMLRYCGVALEHGGEPGGHAAQ